jgi:hypothetical protein
MIAAAGQLHIRGGPVGAGWTLGCPNCPPTVPVLMMRAPCWGGRGIAPEGRSPRGTMFLLEGFFSIEAPYPRLPL